MKNNGMKKNLAIVLSYLILLATFAPLPSQAQCIIPAQTVLVKTTSYTALAADAGKMIAMNCASACTLTLPSSPQSPNWTIWVTAVGAGAVSVSPNGLQINGGTANLTIVPGNGEGFMISTDNANYFAAGVQLGFYAAGGGTAQAQTLTLNPPLAGLAAGLFVAWLPVAANTGAGPTLAVNGLTAKTITKLGTTALVANDLTTTAVAFAIYDGTQFQLLNPQTGSGGGTTIQVGGVATSSTVNFSSTTPAIPSGTPPDAHIFSAQKDSSATNNIDFYDSLAIVQNPVTGRRGWACIASGQTGNRMACAMDGANMIGHAGTDGSTNPTATAPWLTTVATTAVAGNVAGLDIADGNLAFAFGNNTNQVKLYFAFKGSVSTTTSMRFWAGWSNNSVATQGGSATPGGSFAAFRMDSATDTTTIQAITCNAGSCTTTSTSTTLDTAIHKYEIIDEPGVPQYIFRIDGTTVATMTATLPPSGTRATPMATLTTTTTTAITLSLAAMVGTTAQ